MLTENITGPALHFLKNVFVVKGICCKLTVYKHNFLETELNKQIVIKACMVFNYIPNLCVSVMHLFLCVV